MEAISLPSPGSRLLSWTSASDPTAGVTVNVAIMIGLTIGAIVTATIGATIETEPVVT